MIVLVGESASGKSTVEKELVKLGYEKIVSYTTRSPRSGEVGGIDYDFITDAKFDELKAEGFFAETASYNGWQYGIAKDDCTDNKVCVLTPHGLRTVKKIESINVESFYIKVPRRDRLIKILERGDDIEEAYRRSLSDVGQYDGIEDEVDYIYENDGYLDNAEDIALTINAVMNGTYVPE